MEQKAAAKVSTMKASKNKVSFHFSIVSLLLADIYCGLVFVFVLFVRSCSLWRSLISAWPCFLINQHVHEIRPSRVFCITWEESLCLIIVLPLQPFA